MTCQRCGGDNRGGRFCQGCARDVARGHTASTDGGTADPDPKRYRCTGCGGEFTAEALRECPACGNNGVRCLGEADGDDDPPASGGAAVVTDDRDAVTVTLGPTPSDYREVADRA